MADKGLRSWQPCPPRSAGGPSWRRLRPWAGGPGPRCRVPRRSASSASARGAAAEGVIGRFCDLIPMIGGIAPIEILPWWHRRSTFRALLEHLGCRYDAALLLRSTLRRCRARCCARPHDLEPLQATGGWSQSGHAYADNSAGRFGRGSSQWGSPCMHQQLWTEFLLAAKMVQRSLACTSRRMMR